MAYSEDEKESILNSIFDLIENGKSLRSALIEVKISSSTFFIWIDNDLEKSKQYARATELRSEILFDEILEIAYNTEEGITTKETDKGVEVSTGDMLGHRRLKIDAIKWSLSKMNPKKYGDKIDLTTDGDKLPNAIPIVLGNGKSYDDLINELKPE
jgi:hypothetical protein